MQIHRALGKICAKNGIAAKRTQPAHCIHTQLRGCFQAIASQLHGSLFALALAMPPNVCMALPQTVRQHTAGPVQVFATANNIGRA